MVAVVEAAGCGESLGSFELPSYAFDPAGCFIDLQDVLFAHFKSQCLLESLCVGSSEQVRVFAGHNKPELTLVDLQSDSNVLQHVTAWKHWCCQMQAQAQQAERTNSTCEVVLVVAVYNKLDIMRRNLTHGWERISRLPEAQCDKQSALAAIAHFSISEHTYCTSPLGFLSVALKDDEEVVAAAVQASEDAISYASPRLQSSPDILFLQARHTSMIKLPLHLVKSKSFALKLVAVNGLTLGLFDQSVKADKDVVLAAVRQNGLALGVAGVCNSEIVMAAIENNLKAVGYIRNTGVTPQVVNWLANKGYALMLLHEFRPLFASKAFTLSQVAKNGLMLAYVGVLRGDKDVVMAAVQQHGAALKFADGFLQHDKRIVMAAVAQYGQALCYAQLFQGDKEVVMTAVAQDGLALEYADESMQKDKDVVMKAVTTSARAMCMNRFFRTDKDVAMLAATTYASNVGFIENVPELRNEATALYFAAHHGQGVLNTITKAIRTMSVIDAALAAAPEALHDLRSEDVKTKEEQMHVADSFANACRQHKWQLADAKAQAMKCCSRQLCIRILLKILCQLPSTNSSN